MFMETNRDRPKLRHRAGCKRHAKDWCECGVAQSYAEWAEGAAEDHQHRIEWEGDGR